MLRLRLIIPLLLLLTGSAEAHLLKLFAYVEGTRIHGSAYFVGGDGVAGASITISDADDQPLARLKTDPQGVFSYRVETAGEYRLRVDTGEGHQAEWLIHAGEFAPSPAPADVPTGLAVPAAEAVPEQAALSSPQLTALIEQAVARQIGPLRESLQRSQERARLSDILGGVGFIFGLAGIALWWRGRREATRP